MRDLQISRDEARFFLNDGLLIFLKPIDGHRIGAVFSSDIEGGDAEFLLIPYGRAERMSLAKFTKSPTLEERFSAAVLLATDGELERLLERLRAGEGGRPAMEEGHLLASRWNSVLRSLSNSFEIRLINDLLAGRTGPSGFFFAAIAGQALGNFDFIFDPRSRNQITLGQLTSRDGRAYYDLWTYFASRSFRSGQRNVPPRDLAMESYKIDTEVRPDLRVEVVTRMKASVPATAASLVFELSPRMDVTSAEVNGVAAEVFRRDSIRANLLRGDQNEALLVVPSQPLEPGRSHEIVVKHEGNVIGDAGNRVFSVAARINWYPQHGIQFSPYDLTFTVPKQFTLVATGDLVEDRIEGDRRWIHRQSKTPIRFAGFNLGDYARTSVTRAGYRVDVYANKQLETSLTPSAAIAVPPPPMQGPRRRLDPMAVPPAPMPPNPAAAIESMAGEIAAELEMMAQRFGPPPLKTLSVSPIPGYFGQGFPGLLYLSTLSYLNVRPRFGDSLEARAFYRELLHAHETAHQWWGNSVASAGYEDDWVQEAIANYMALVVLEKHRGTKAMESVLAEYRERLMQKTPDGEPVEALGPVTFGLRLQTSQAPSAWRTIIYDKGAWIVHMLRRRMGEELFWAMLAEGARRYRGSVFTTAQFRDLAAEFVAKQPVKESYRAADPKLEAFFETWTQGTGIPTIKLRSVTTGVAPKISLTLTISQTDVTEDFSDVVPVEIQLGRGKSITRWIRTSSEPVSVSIPLTAAPLKVSLDPQGAMLKR